MTGRYNFTDDWRDLPKTGEALFSTLRPEVRAQNFSFFLNSQLHADGAPRELFNQVRLSYGRTRLRFLPVRACVASVNAYSNDCLLPSDAFASTDFLLNRPLFGNATLPPAAGQPNRDSVVYERITNGPAVSNTESATGPLGQVFIAGFSPLGVDVYNFPQRRVNNTYQLADVLTLRTGDHNFAFGADVRRTELNSDLRRQFRPLITFNGAPRLEVAANGQFRTLAAGAPFAFVRPEDLAAVGAASNVFLTLAYGRSDANINLRFYQYNVFAQDHWRVRPALTLSYGLRYEYNSPARETHSVIERTFNSTERALVPSLQRFAGGRTSIYDPDRDNFAPRLSLAYAPSWFGRRRASVLRAGFGVFYDQVLGAVVSQSRNVYPNFLPLNFSGLAALNATRELGYSNPATTSINGQRLVRRDTLNQAEVALTPDFINALTRNFPNAIGETLPTRRLLMPQALHYSLAYEQQLSDSLTISFAYVGTQGRHLLRFTTPNLGPGVNAIPLSFGVDRELNVNSPQLFGRVCTPTATGLCAGRPAADIGSVSVFETSANSRYDALQIEARARLSAGLQTQASYTLSSARDDVSDVFELAGAFALPQNSLDLRAERGPANFDLRNRVTFSLVYDFPNERRWLRGVRVASIGRFQSGPPFTVNSVFDVNLDGNLTDRLNTTDGLSSTGNGRQPLLLQTSNATALLAAPGQAGRIGRNSFRADGLTEINLALSKSLRFATTRALLLRADLFNLLNNANYGIPVRLLEAPGFGRATNTVTPGFRLQLGVKLEF